MNRAALRALVRDRWVIALTLFVPLAIALQVIGATSPFEAVFWSAVLAVAWGAAVGSLYLNELYRLRVVPNVDRLHQQIQERAPEMCSHQELVKRNS